MHFLRDDSDRKVSRIDLVLAPSEVIAMFTDSVVNDGRKADGWRKFAKPRNDCAKRSRTNIPSRSPSRDAWGRLAVRARVHGIYDPCGK